MSKPIVAIVGRPNVGKSSLFNRLIGERKAVVEDYPGTTRDRLYADVEWAGHTFTLVDTGGMATSIEKDDAIGQGLRRQIDAAVDEADVLVFMVDGQVPPSAEDDYALKQIRKSRRPVILVVNKLDSPVHDTEVANFYQLGLGEPFGLSALAGRGTGDLLDRIISHLPGLESAVVEENEKDSVKIAIIGRPNVGKSTLLNQLLNEERVIVSDIPGTTRDTVDVEIEYEGKHVTLLDTAGIRKRGKVEKGIEHYSVMRAMHAIERCDVVFVVFDAGEGLTQQDMHILGYALDQYKSIVLIANKWDLMKEKHLEIGVPKDQLIRYYERSVKEAVKFVDFAPFVTISALQNLRVSKLLDMGLHVYQQRFVQVPQAELRRLLQAMIVTAPLPSKRGVTLHIVKYQQIATNPPTLQVEVNDPVLFHFSLQRMMVNRIREVYPFEGTPIRFVIKTKIFKKRG
jgi:GTPase